MTEIQLPVPVTHLFAEFGITDPAQVLISLLSLVLGVLLVLIVLIAFRGGPSKSNSSHQKGTPSAPFVAEKQAVETIVSEATPLEGDDALAAQSTNRVENPEFVAKHVEDFQIFKRPTQKSIPAGRIAPSLEENDKMSTADHLRLIEKEMVRLRELYQGGHITRDMYIDETRSLYHQARELSSIS